MKSDQQIWDEYYATKPISEVPTDEEQDTSDEDWVVMLGGLIAMFLLIGALALLLGGM